MPLTTRFHDRFGSIAHRDWDRCFPGEVERHAYYAACTKSAKGEPVAVTVSDGGTVIAVAPLFHLDYRLDTSLQGPLRALSAPLGRFATLRLAGLGSPLAERCHLGFDPGLDRAGRQAAFGALLDGLEAHARANRIGLLAVKDLAGQEASEAGPLLAVRRYARVPSLPVAVLDVPETEADYFARLSPATRKDIRRKLRTAGRVSVEMASDIAAIADEIQALYEETRAQSRFDYGDLERLPDGYFHAVSRALGGDAVFMLYRVEGRLAAFNLLLVEEDRIIDKFLGMRYPLAREHNLYALSWMTNLRLCMARGVRLLQTGQTAYAPKLRMGSRLQPTDVWFRHLNPVVNAGLRAAAPFFAFDRNDPDLKSLAPRRAAP